MQVVALIHQENGFYEASFPDFPGCCATAPDPDTLVARAADALALHIERTIESGGDVPQVRSLALLANDATFATRSAGRMIALVPCRRAVTVTIAMDAALLATVDRAAAAAGETRSAYLCGAARQRLTRAPDGQPDAVQGATAPLRPHGDSMDSPSQEPSPVTEDSGTAASLASIKEMLERLDAPTAPETGLPVLRPARRGLA